MRELTKSRVLVWNGGQGAKTDQGAWPCPLDLTFCCEKRDKHQENEKGKKQASLDRSQWGHMIRRWRFRWSRKPQG